MAFMTLLFDFDRFCPIFQIFFRAIEPRDSKAFIKWDKYWKLRHQETLKGLVLAPKLSGFTKCQHYSVVLNKVSAFHTTTALHFTNVLSLFYLSPPFQQLHIQPEFQCSKMVYCSNRTQWNKNLTSQMDSPFVITTILLELLAMVLERVV